MGLRKHRLDLVTRVHELDEQLDEIEASQDDVLEKAEQADEVPQSLEERWDELEAEKVELHGNKKKFIETVVVWSSENNVVADDPAADERFIGDVEWEEVKEVFGEIESMEFVVQELTFGQLQAVSDQMMEESFEVDVRAQDLEGTPKQGFYQLELLKEAIVRSPPSAPSTTDEYGNPIPEPGDYPIAVGEWLYDRVNALNTTGETEMGNSSLEDAMNSGS